MSYPSIQASALLRLILDPFDLPHYNEFREDSQKPVPLSRRRNADRDRLVGADSTGGKTKRAEQDRTQGEITSYGVWIDDFPEVRLTNFILKA